MYDAIIVGGGPSGAAVAGALAERGFSVLIVEEHREVGRPVQCSGLVSPAVLRMAGSSQRVRLREFKKAKIFTGKEELDISASDVKAVAMDRAMFDRELMEKAVRKGADIMLGTRAVSFRRDERGILSDLRSSGESITIRSRVLIGADGVTSSVARAFDMGRPKEVLGAFQAHITDEVDEIRIWPEPDSAFFTWQIPMEDGSLIGTASPGNPPALSILKRRFPGFESRSITYHGGAIPIGNSRKITDKNVALVGDAAVQVKPLSGGGLYPGLSAARILVDSTVSALEKDSTDLSSYQKKWQSDVGKEIKNGMYIRKVYAELSEKDMEKIMHELNNANSKRIISELGDIDHPSLLARPLVKSTPKLLVFARHLLGLLI